MKNTVNKKNFGLGIKIIAVILAVLMLQTAIPSITVLAEKTNAISSNNALDIDVKNKSQKEPEIIGELSEKRTLNEKYFLMDDGSITVAQYSQPVHFVDSEGSMKDIDNSLVEVTDTATDKKLYKNKSNSFNVFFSKESDNGDLAFLEKDEYKIAWSLKQNNITTAKKIETEKTADKKADELENITSSIEYDDVFDSTDITYVTNANGVKENIVLKDENSPKQFSFNYNTYGLKYRITDEGNIELYNKEDTETVVFYIEKPYMFDAQKYRSDDVKMEVTETEKGFDVIIIPDEEWINSRERVYPIVIDPTVLSSQIRNQIWDIDMMQGQSHDFNHNAEDLVVGVDNQGRVFRSVVKMCSLPTIEPGNTIVNATFNITAYQGPVKSGAPALRPRPSGNPVVNLHRVTDYWPEITNWNTTADKYDPIVSDYFVYNQTDSGFQADVTKLVAGWYEGRYPNYGIMIKCADETTVNRALQFTSSDWGYGTENYFTWRPALTISYRNTAGLEDYWSYTTQECDGYATSYVNNYNGNLVFVHPDVTFNSDVNGFTLAHIYNSCNSQGESGRYGNGWRLNLVQRLDAVSINTNSYVKFKYTDGDGTEHYLVESEGKIVDEDGLGLTYSAINEVVDSGTTPLTAQLKTKDDTVMKFDVWGFLRRIIGKNGNTIFLNYSPGSTMDKNHLTLITTSSGGHYELVYDSSYNLTQINDNVGRTTRFEMANGDLMHIWYPDGNGTHFTYTNHRIVIVQYPFYRRYIYGYDSLGRISSVTAYDASDSAGASATFEYNVNQTCFIDGDGRKTTYQFDNWGRVACAYDDSQNIYSQSYTDTITLGSGIFSNNKIKLNSNGSVYVNNLLKNGSFSAGLDGWTEHTNSGAMIISEHSIIGTNSVKVESSSEISAKGIAQTGIIAESGKTYTLSGYIRAENITSSVGKGAAIEILTSDNRLLYSEFVSGSTDTETDDGFSRVSVTVSLSAGETISRITAGLYNAAGTAYINGLQLEEGEVANAVNLVNNSSFERNSGGGTMPENFAQNFNPVFGDYVVPALGLQYGRDGSASMRMIGIAGQSKHISQTILTSGKKGDAISFGSWAMATSVSTRTVGKKFGMIAEFGYTDGTTEQTELPFNCDVDHWQFAAKTTVAKKDFNCVNIFLCYYNNCNEAYFDSVFLYRDTAQSYTYDNNGNVISTSDYAKQQSSFEYQGANMKKMVSTSGGSYEYSYGYGGKQNIVTAKSSAGIGYNFAYNFPTGSASPTVAQMYSGHNSSPITLLQAYYLTNCCTGKNIQPLNRSSSQGTDIVQFTREPVSLQKWFIMDEGDGYVHFETGDATAMRIAVRGGIAAVNQPLELSSSTGDETKFKIVFDSLTLSYSIRSKLDESMAVCSNLGSMADNNTILLYPFDAAGPDKYWLLNDTTEEKADYSAPEAGKGYYISDMQTYRYFDIPGLAKAAGVPLTQYCYLSGSNQRFTLEQQGEYYLLIPNHDTSFAISTSGNGTDVVMQPKNTADTSQHFSITELPGGCYRITPRNFPGKAVSLPNGISIPSGNIQSMDYIGAPWQKWRFEESTTRSFNTSDLPENGQRYFIMFNHDNFYFDVPDMRLSGESALTQYYFLGGINQQFQLLETDGGYFKVAACHSRELLLMTLIPDSSGNGTGQLYFRPEDGSTYQQFKFVPTLGGTYRMVCRASASDNYCVEIPNGTNGYSDYAHYSLFSQDIYPCQRLTLRKIGSVVRTTAAYDSGGNHITSFTDELGNTVNYTYDTTRGLKTSVTDARNNITSYGYNAFNDRLVSVSSGGSTVAYSYNGNGDLERITSPSGVQYSFTYDSFGRSTAINIGNRTLSLTEYLSDRRSLVSKLTYGNATVRTYSYDNQDRLISESINGTERLRYLYDKRSNLTRKTDLFANLITDFLYDLSGRITGISVSNGQKLKISYDNLNRVIRSKWTLNDFSYSTVYTYGDSLTTGRKTELIYGLSLNGSERLTYIYDRLNRLKKRIINTSAPFVTEYGFAQGGEMGTTSTVVNSVKNGNDTLTYTYDGNGNITEIKKNGNTVEEYEYDSLNQLISATYGGNTYTYTYDNGGNITEVKLNGNTVKSYTYGDTSWKDLLTAYNNQTFTYDNIGNPLTYRNGFNFTWVNGRELAAVSNGTNSISYTYSEGIRTSKTVNNVTTDYYWINDVLQAQKTGDEYIIFLYDENGAPYGFVVRNGAVENTYYYTFNLQGDVIGIIDINGNTVVEYTYGAWGEVLSVTGTLASTIGQKNPIRYRGYYFDSETGFYYLQSRYYDPETGRFLNADGEIDGSGESVQGYNLFAYCNNNPVNMSDENGNWPKWAKKLVVAVAVVAVVAAVAAITVATAGAGTAAAVIAVSAAKGAAIGLAVGAATGAAGGAISHRVTTGSWKGAGQAALNGMAEGALSGAITGAITGAASGAVRVSQAAQTFDKGTFKSSYQSLKYHYDKHVIQEGLNKSTSILKYAEDAASFSSRNASMLKYTYNFNYGNTSWNYSYTGQGGIFTALGKTITFWYN